MEEFYTLDTVSTGDVCPHAFVFVLFFFKKLQRLWLIGNRTSRRPIRIGNHMQVQFGINKHE